MDSLIPSTKTTKSVAQFLHILSILCGAHVFSHDLYQNPAAWRWLHWGGGWGRVLDLWHSLQFWLGVEDRHLLKSRVKTGAGHHYDGCSITMLSYDCLRTVANSCVPLNSVNHEPYASSFEDSSVLLWQVAKLATRKSAEILQYRWLLWPEDTMTDTITQIGHGLKSGRHRDDVPCSLNSGATGDQWACGRLEPSMLVLFQQG